MRETCKGHQFCEPEAVEQFIRDLSWSKFAKDIEKTLVAGNIRNFAAQARLAMTGCPDAPSGQHAQILDAGDRRRVQRALERYQRCVGRRRLEVQEVQDALDDRAWLLEIVGRLTRSEDIPPGGQLAALKDLWRWFRSNGAHARGCRSLAWWLCLCDPNPARPRCQNHQPCDCGYEAILDRLRGIDEPGGPRCEVTGHPVGTDTRLAGSPADCPTCDAHERPPGGQLAPLSIEDRTALFSAQRLQREPRKHWPVEAIVALDNIVSILERRPPDGQHADQLKADRDHRDQLATALRSTAKWTLAADGDSPCWCIGPVHGHDPRNEACTSKRIVLGFVNHNGGVQADPQEERKL